MKKTLLFWMFVVLSCMTSIAQTAITEGFYRVQNKMSERYLYVRDCTGDINTLGADMGAIELWLGKENTISDPSSVMFFKNAGGAWDIQSQATGVYEMTAHYMTISSYGGGYVVYNSGQYLYDIVCNNTTEKGRIGAKTDKEMPGKTGYKIWNVLPINSSTDSYFGFKPTISAGGSYYTTFYADFAFTPKSDNTKVWYVSKIDKEHGVAVIKQLTGTISRSQPVIIQSNSSQTTNNRVDLSTATGSSASANKLVGVYFSNGDRSFEVHPGNPACVEFNAKTMRMLGVNANGKLAFINNPSNLVDTEIDPGTGTWRAAKVVPHNQAYLKVDADCPASLQVMTESEYNEYIASQRSYTLTYMVDGQIYKQYTLKAGAAITPEPAPSKTGYSFSGWSNLPTVMPANDVTVTGTFSVNSYKLTYIVDGQTYKTLTVNYGAAITPEAAPTKTGHTFSGWSTIPTTMPANDVTVTGSFSVNSYKLTYVVDGQTYKTLTINYGATITPEAAPTKTGHTFSGWSTIPITMPANDVTVTGTFSVNSYKLTYYVDNEVYKTYNINYGAEITPEDLPVREGYEFSGWNDVPSVMPDHDVDVYGSFSIGTYTLTYKVDGEVYMTFNYEYRERLNLIDEPSREGYTFSGWSELPKFMPAYDIEVNGYFNINNYTITYTYNGETLHTVTLAYGSEIPAYSYQPETNEDFIYSFVEWQENGETFTLTNMPARNVVLVAIVDALPTGINNVSQSTSTVIFDLQGRRVTSMKRGGMYIINGQKYLHR